MAADRGVRVFTVGVGTPNGEVIGFEGWSFRARLDEDTLKAIADLTRGEYFHAGTAMDLKKVYRGLNARLVFEKKRDRDHRALLRGGCRPDAAVRVPVAALVQPDPVTAFDRF